MRENLLSGNKKYQILQSNVVYNRNAIFENFFRKSLSLVFW